MRHKGVAKEETRQKMLDAAGRGFRSRGFTGIGVDGLAKEAGATSGAFYAHFGSKAAAFDAALAVGLDEVIDAVPTYQEKHGGEWVKAFADYYLGKHHRKDLACGCAMATLTPEVVRADSGVQGAYERKMNTIADLMASGLAGSSRQERRARAWALLGVLIGGINVARAMKGARMAEEVADAIIDAALIAAGRTRANKNVSAD